MSSQPGIKKEFKQFKRWLKSWLEWLIYGGRWREYVLVQMLGALHRSQFKRERKLATTPPHFTNDRIHAFDLVYGKLRNPYFFGPGFFVSELIRPDDVILDIGCGDGFISNSFFSRLAKHIDAIDIEPSAIEMAERLNASPKIKFQLLDAVKQPFPQSNYNIIVWNGAIGHFPPQDIETMLVKIKAALAPNGVFAGSEALGPEGFDHLQFFDTEADLAALFKPHFKHVWVRTARYPIVGGYVRTEGYWRCSNDTVRHSEASWKSFA